jgi:GMP synthase (glutamine-hydrolysing)
MLLIIDNKSTFIRVFEKELKKRKVPYKVLKANQRFNLKKIRNIQGIVLSGGPLTPYDHCMANDYIALMNFDVPTIGFCLGHELIAVAFGGTIKKLPHRQYKVQEVVIDNPRDPIFKGLAKKAFLREKHYNHVKKLPKDFRIIAHSDVCRVEVMRHKRRKIYGFQSHPEASGKDGQIIMHNFLKMCKIDFRFTDSI